MSAVRIGRTLVAAAVIALAGPSAHARPSDAAIRQLIIQQSIADYQATGHPCACPYNVARNGSTCGARSAYSRPGGAAPMCYARDVTPGMIQDWLASHH